MSICQELLQYSHQFDQIESGKLCSAKLKFQSFKYSADKNKFYIFCETFDGVKVVCFGFLNLDHANLVCLKKDEEIEMKNALIKFRQQRPNHTQNDLMLIKASEIYRDSFGVKTVVMKSTEKMTNKPSGPSNSPKNTENMFEGILPEIPTNPPSISPSISRPIIPQNRRNRFPPMPPQFPRYPPFPPPVFQQGPPPFPLMQLPMLRLQFPQNQQMNGPNFPAAEKKGPKLTFLQEVSRFPLFKPCTTTFKISSYIPNENKNCIFINCLTMDEKPVTIVSNISRHDEETELMENDVVKFENVIRVKPKGKQLGLTVVKITKIYLLSRNGEILNEPKEMLQFKFLEKKKNKERGTLKTQLEEINQFRSNFYVADFLLNDGKQVKLVIDKEFGRWPKHYLKVNDPLVFDALPEVYEGQEARFIKKGSYFDYNDEPVKADEFTCPICYEEVPLKEGQITCRVFEAAENDEENEEHGICLNCIKELAKTALTDAPLASGGIGLQCCVPECKNVFLMSEFGTFLDEKVREPLMNRMQHESILAAKLDDLVKCSECGNMVCVEKQYPYYDCSCGVRKCRHCPRLYDKVHELKTCEEMDKIEKLDQINKIGLSEIVVRQCPNCHVQFMKEDGCNKMTCRCGTMQCYLCRDVIKGYEHFCQCDNGKDFDKPCTRCTKICPLFGDAEKYDNERLEKFRQDKKIN